MLFRSELTIIEIDGIITLIPILDPEFLRKTSKHEFAALMEKSHQIDLELEK